MDNSLCFRNGQVLQALLLGLCLAVTCPAGAHPMGNFAICHYTRITAEQGSLRVRHILDMAEIPTATETIARPGRFTPADKEAYLKVKALEIQNDISLLIQGMLVPLSYRGGAVDVKTGAGGLPTLRIITDWSAALPHIEQPTTIDFMDRSYPNRTGWKEIVAQSGSGLIMRESSVPAMDISHELTRYPSDFAPPQVTEARLLVAFNAGKGFVTVPAHLRPIDALRPSPVNISTPHDAFSQLITVREPSSGLMFLGLGVAFLFGALHAFSPGHGKTMVAAYLVGTRGTARHAVSLGLIVTLTHTFGVFLLGLTTLFASRYIVPERLYGWLNLFSGAAVFGVGAVLLVSRLKQVAAGHSQMHSHNYDYANMHDHGLEASSHIHTMPDGPITPRALLVLGVSGGIVPCPSALVVLLSAIALHRIGYGLLLISAFSVGLASVLVAFGLAAVQARSWFERIPGVESLTQRLPVFSAALITITGLALMARTLFI